MTVDLQIQSSIKLEEKRKNYNNIKHEVEFCIQNEDDEQKKCIAVSEFIYFQVASTFMHHTIRKLHEGKNVHKVQKFEYHVSTKMKRKRKN